MRPGTSCGLSQQAAALLPLGLLLAPALIAALVLSKALHGGHAVIIPHVTAVISFAGLLYGWVLASGALRVPRTFARVVGRLAAVTMGFLLTTFYFVLFASLFLFKELPTRQLISGYANDLPALLQALPATGATLLILIGAVCSVGILLGVLIAWAFDRGWVAIESWRERRSGAVLSRVLVYGAVVHLLFAIQVPLDWHANTREPVFSSWHDLRLNHRIVYGPANPLQLALDAKAEAAYPRFAATRTPNVILIYIDALRADATQPYGAKRKNMPHLSELVASGRLRQVEMAVAACPSTICGIGAILQSKPTWLQGPDNFSLPKVLARQGYRNAYVLASNHQSYYDLKDYYRPFDFFLDGKDLSPNRHGNDYLVLDGLDRLGQWDGRPTFLMIGLISPHVGGIRAPANRVYTPDRFSFAGGKDEFREAYRNNYDNGIVQADDVLSKVWKKLETNGFLEGAIVVITADHGESLGEHGTFGHLTSLAHVELNIPLWIRDDRLQSDRIPFARQIDIAPTILDSLGLPIPDVWYGRSLHTAPPEVEWSEHYVPDFRGKIAIIRHDVTATIKYFYDRNTGEESAFDLRRDPLEQVNIIRALPAQQLDEMRKRAKSHLLGR